MELILEQQRMKEWPKVWLIYYLLKGKDNTDYAEIAKELRTKNEEIYNTVMVSNAKQLYCILQYTHNSSHQLFDCTLALMLHTLYAGPEF